MILSFVFLLSCGEKKNEDFVKSYYDDGTIKSELRYKDGKLNGECWWYYQNGKPQLKITYTNDTLNGEAMRWYDNGNIESRYYFSNDQYDGLFESYKIALEYA